MNRIQTQESELMEEIEMRDEENQELINRLNSAEKQLKVETERRVLAEQQSSRLNDDHDFDIKQVRSHLQGKVSDLQLEVKLKTGECEHIMSLYE